MTTLKGIQMTETERFVGNVYQNARGLKSKIVSLAETIDDYEPTLICLVETHLSKEK